jgi:hypothetical protein
VAYQADILINVKGFQDLTRIQKALEGTARKIDEVNASAARLGAPVRNIEKFSKQLELAERALQKVAVGSPQEQRAVSNYVTALNNANVAKTRQNKLIQEEITGRNAATIAIRTNVEKNIEQSKVTRAVRQETAQLNAELVKRARLERQLASRGLMQLATGRVVKGTDAGFGVQGPALPPTRTAARSGGSRDIGGAVSSAIIGGGFPLLFGQGPGAAAGGALGGLAGGLLGGGFGFALSIAGTAIGDLITKSEALDKSLASLNSSLSSTGSTSVTTAADVSRLASNLRITNEEAVELLGTFSQFGDANIREAVASLFGGVGGASTFEAIARAGIDEKNALSSVFQLRQLIGNEAATQLALQLNTVGATQTQAALLKLVVERSIQSSVAASKQVQFTDNLLSIWENIVAGVATALSLATQFIKKMQEGQLIQLPFLDQVIQILGGGTKARTGKQIADERGAALEKTLRDQIKAVRDAVKQETGVLSTQTTLAEAFKPQKEDRAAEEAAREAARVAEVVRTRQLATLELKRQAVFSREIAQAEMDKDPILVRQRQGQQELMRLGIQTAAELEKEKNSMAQLAIAREAQAKRALIMLDIELDVAKIEQQRKENFDTIIADLELELKLKTATTEQAREQLRLEAERAKLEKQLKGLPQSQIDQATALQAQVAAPLTDAQNIEQRIGKLKDEVAELTNIGNIAITVADGIGVAFSQAFQGLISGSMSAQEALGSFFKSVGDMFVSMATEIIAKQMTMIILQTILKALGATGGVGGGGGDFSGAFKSAPGTSFADALNMPQLAANGASFANGIAKFADGGIVSSSTLFKFADGGTTKTGLMGEAGPEAIMPLKRGASGRLGVDASGLREAMNSQNNGVPSSPVLNMSFESTTIGGVEYVSRDQLEQAMAETRRASTREGAKRGMSMALDRIQNSSSTRKRIGV